MQRRGVAVEANRPLIFQSSADVIGCLVAPIPIVAVGIAESFLYTSFDAVTIAIFSFIAYIVALGVTLLPGYVIYRLLVRLNAFRWWTSILAGFSIGALATILIANPANILSNGVLINASASAISGFLFWLVQRGKWHATTVSG